MTSLSELIYGFYPQQPNFVYGLAVDFRADCLFSCPFIFVSAMTANSLQDYPIHCVLISIF